MRRILAGALDFFRGRRRGRSDDDPRFDEPSGGVGVREPLRPRPSPRSGAVALELPREDEATG
jgi:hypothetical protein